MPGTHVSMADGVIMILIVVGRMPVTMVIWPLNMGPAILSRANHDRASQGDLPQQKGYPYHHEPYFSHTFYIQSEHIIDAKSLCFIYEQVNE